jgi:hypothetical protein
VPSKEGNPSLIFGSIADYKLFPFEFVCLQLANVEQLGPKKTKFLYASGRHNFVDPRIYR